MLIAAGQGGAVFTHNFKIWLLTVIPMEKTTLIFLILVLAALMYYLGRTKSVRLVEGRCSRLHSLPVYYGNYAAMWLLFPGLAVISLWFSFEDSILTHLIVSGLPVEIMSQSAEQLGLFMNDVKNVVNGTSSESEDVLRAVGKYRELSSTSNQILAFVTLVVSLVGGWLAYSRIAPGFHARNHVETWVRYLLILCSSLAVLTTIGIILSVLLESLRFFNRIPVTEFLFGTSWSPQTAMRSDQVASEGAFGAIPLFMGTLLISLIALSVAVPVGLLAAIYLSEYASPRFRAIAKPLLEILAGIPTVVYGFFAALVLAPAIRELGSRIGLDVSSESALAAGLVMGIMIIPFVSSLADDFINAVPQSLRDGAYALGATQSEAIRQVVIPAALPGVVGGILLAASRAIGETMIVVMASGLTANLTLNPLEAVTTVTTQIVTLLVGDQEFDSAKTLAAFALGLVLFVVTLVLNIISLYIVRKYREQYE
jgi:phosphate transport system permease protein